MFKGLINLTLAHAFNRKCKRNFKNEILEERKMEQKNIHWEGECLQFFSYCWMD